jgi:hypothetical protein
MYKMVAVTIREVLDKSDTFNGWLYLPKEPWSLDTEGIFIKEDKNADPSDPFPPAILEPCHLKEALDAAGIEDVISNAEAQLGSPSIHQLFEALLFYIENDAFIEFE